MCGNDYDHGVRVCVNPSFRNEKEPVSFHLFYNILLVCGLLGLGANSLEAWLEVPDQSCSNVLPQMASVEPINGRVLPMPD